MNIENWANCPTGNENSLQLLRVLRQDRGVYSLFDGNRLCKAELGGRFRHDNKDPSLIPTVGDIVTCGQPDESGLAKIVTVLPRKNALLRKAPISGGKRVVAGLRTGGRTEAQVMAANVDTAFIVSAAGQDTNGRRLERYLLMLRDSQIPTVILLNKCDLAEDNGESQRLTLTALLPDPEATPLLCISAKTGAGLEQLQPWLGEAKSAVFIGSSGAGKTSLLQALGAPAGKTAGISSYKEKGRHTTSRRESFWLPGGCLVIDTPGIRELQLWCETDSIDDLFAEIVELTTQCQYRNCRHDSEPGCAIKAALQSGQLDPRRYDSWRKLRTESQNLAQRQRQVQRGGRPKTAPYENE